MNIHLSMAYLEGGHPIPDCIEWRFPAPNPVHRDPQTVHIFVCLWLGNTGIQQESRVDAGGGASAHTDVKFRDTNSVNGSRKLEEAHPTHRGMRPGYCPLSHHIPPLHESPFHRTALILYIHTGTNALAVWFLYDENAATGRRTTWISFSSPWLFRIEKCVDYILLYVWIIYVKIFRWILEL